MISYQWTSALIGLAIAGTIFYLVRRNHLHGPFAVWWLLVSVAVILISIMPSMVDYIAALLGIAYPPILPVFIGMGLILIKMLTMDLERSRQERRIRRLTQRLAILEAQLPQKQPPSAPAQKPEHPEED